MAELTSTIVDYEYPAWFHNYPVVQGLKYRTLSGRPKMYVIQYSLIASEEYTNDILVDEDSVWLCTEFIITKAIRETIYLTVNMDGQEVIERQLVTPALYEVPFDPGFPIQRDFYIKLENASSTQGHSFEGILKYWLFDKIPLVQLSEFLRMEGAL